MFELISEPFGGGALTRAFVAGSLPSEWGIAAPCSPGGWTDRVHTVRDAASPDWLDRLEPAFRSGGEARSRLQATAAANGVVVTTGQQPGLFGGPLYTLYKAITALAFANELQQSCGVPVAPVFWAATDDSDLAEANWTAVAKRGGAELIRIDARAQDGVPLMRVPVGDASQQLAHLLASMGTSADSGVLDAIRDAYSAPATIGSSYVTLLRALLNPLGISVLDASHPAVRAAGAPTLRSALENAHTVDRALHARNADLRATSLEPQVHEVQGLSLVFIEERGVRRRATLEEADMLARSAHDTALSPNVLLRPVVEAKIMPVAAYVGGPAELAYFAQSAAVADAIAASVPLAVPRWSGTIVDLHIGRILDRLRLSVNDLASPHEAWGRLARGGVPESVLTAISDLKNATDAAFDRILDDAGRAAAFFERPALVQGARAGVLHRIARFERRAVAIAKRRDARLADDLATARGALFPLGKRQERALGFATFLARYGMEVIESIRDAAGQHSRTIIHGSGSQSDAHERSAMSALPTGD